MFRTYASTLSVGAIHELPLLLQKIIVLVQNILFVATTGDVAKIAANSRS